VQINKIRKKEKNGCHIMEQPLDRKGKREENIKQASKQAGGRGA
jgi:hypothetical protein